MSFNNVQDAFLSKVAELKTDVDIYLANGIRLNGKITERDTFCFLLERNGTVQLVYKHGVSTICPSK